MSNGDTSHFIFFYFYCIPSRPFPAGEYMEHSDSDPISFLQAGLLEDDPTTRPHITITLTPGTPCYV